MVSKALDRAAVAGLEGAPKQVLSRLVGEAARVPLPGPMQWVVNEAFATFAGVDRGAFPGRPGDYASLNAFFTRPLDEGAREVETTSGGDRRRAVSPVDGELSTFGEIEDGTLLQAKGRTYSVLELLDSWEQARDFQTGAYATFYLSPSAYHRIHSPVAGEVESIAYIPGELFPVFPFAVERIDRLFAVNERLVSYLDVGAAGRVAVVKVGATCVGRISVAYHDLETNTRPRRRRDIDLDAPVPVEAGEEIGTFHLGSTVVVLCSNPAFEFAAERQRGEPIEMGRRWGSLPEGEGL